MQGTPSLQTIVFKPVHPPRNDPASLTYFGGYPTLSKELAWPIDRTTRLPLLFIGQVDLSTLPEIARHNGLPAAGVLHFFGDYEDDESAAVLFSNEASKHLVETPPPDNARDLFKTYPLTRLAWARPAVARPHAYPKWAMEPVACGTHSVTDLETSRRSFAETFPPPQSVAAMNPFPAQGRGQAPKLWIPDAAFPYLWVYIEAWCNQLLADRSFLRLEKEPPQDPGMAQACRDWIARAGQKGRLTPTTEQDVAAFWSFVRALRDWQVKAVPTAAMAGLARRIVDRTATAADRTELRALLARPEMIWRSALQTIPQQAEKVASGELGVKEATSLSEWLDTLSSPRETSTLNEITRETLQVVTNLLLGYSPEIAGAIPAAVIAANRRLHWPRVEQRHQMFGHRQALYGALFIDGKMQPTEDRYLKTHQLLMQFSSSDGMCWTWGDVGEYLFWITEDDLRNRRFDQVTAAIECS
jgi:hypothetical protein